METSEQLSRRLLQAAIEDNLDEVKRLVEAGADVNFMDEHRSTPVGVSCDNLPRMRFLLEHRANPNVYDGGGQSAVSHAVCLGRIEIVKLMIEHGAHLDEPGNAILGTTLLMEALEHRQVEIMKLLLRHGADPLQEDGDGWNLYRLAEVNGQSADLREAGL